MGEPDEIVAFIGDAPIAGDASRAVLRGDDGPAAPAEADRGVARRPGQYRHGRGPRRAASGSSTRPDAMPRAVAEFTIGAILAETRLITRGHEALRRGEWRGDLYRADLTGDELVGDDGRRRRLWPYRHEGGAHPQGVRLPDPGLRPLCSACRSTICATASSRSASIACWRGPTSSACTRGSPTRPRASSARRNLRAMKPGAFFINTARGPLVDYRGAVRGAGLRTICAAPRSRPLRSSPFRRTGRCCNCRMSR